MINFKKHYPKLKELAAQNKPFEFNLRTGEYKILAVPNLESEKNHDANIFFFDANWKSLNFEIADHINYFGITEEDLDGFFPLLNK